MSNTELGNLVAEIREHLTALRLIGASEWVDWHLQSLAPMIGEGWLDGPRSLD